MRFLKRLLAALVLIILAPVFGELLNGFLSPREFIIPIRLALNLAFYSCGAILVREAVIRWKKGWPSMIALGAAYGILEEGLMVKNFFNPAKCSYGRLGGINWVFMLGLIFFHAFISISIPIVMTHLMFPRQRKEAWLPGWSLIGFATFLTWGFFFGFQSTPYRPPLLQYSLVWLVFYTLIGVAWRLPREPLRPQVRPPVRPLWFGLLGFAATVLHFALGFIIPNTPLHEKIPAGLIVLLQLGQLSVLLGVVLRLSGNGGSWTARHRYALCAGALLFFVLFVPMVAAGHKKDPRHEGKRWVGLAGFVFLGAMSWRARAVEKWEAGEALEASIPPRLC